MLSFFMDPDVLSALIEMSGAIVLCVLSAFIIPWLRARAAAANSQAMSAAVEAISAAAGPAVAATEQLVARKLRATAPAIGSLTTDQAGAALAESVARVAGHFGEDKLEAVGKILGKSREELDELIKTHVEAAVLKLKASAAPKE